jgi:hypothetical protein
LAPRKNLLPRGPLLLTVSIPILQTLAQVNLFQLMLVAVYIAIGGAWL